MNLRLTSDDEELLASLVQYRVLSVSHLVVLHQRNPAALRHRLARLKKAELLHMFTRGLGSIRGRPENLVTISAAGLELLKARGRVEDTVSCGAVVPKPHDMEHQLLISDFRVGTVQMQQLVPCVRVRDLATGAHRSESEFRELGFIPDGVLAISDDAAGKTVLFFLEADRGTEPSSSSQPGRGIHSKVAAYRSCFQSGAYKRYEPILGCALRGFRVLFVVEGETRLVSLGRAVQAMPPSDFVWLTSRERMIVRGVWAPIWVRGGRLDQPPESILGTRLPDPCPAPRSGQPASQNDCSTGSSQPQPR